MGITEVTVPKQYVLVQTTEPTGAFEGQLWYNSSEDLTYIFQDGDWKLITLDVSQEVLDLATENAQQQIDIIELQANASVTPFDHDTLISDTFSDADGYKDSVNTDNTDATFNTNKYERNNLEALGLNLISFYEFEETSGTTASDSVGSNDLTNIGTATVNQTGFFNKAYSYDGTNDYCVSGSSLTGATINDITITAWFKPSANSGTLFSFKRNPVTGFNSFSSEINPSGNVTFTHSNGSAHNNTTSSNTVTLNQWNFVALRFSNSTSVSIYLNGTKTDGTPVTKANTLNDLFYIGANFNNNVLERKFTGIIDEVGIWDTALTDNMISLIYNSGDGVIYNTTNYSETASTPIRTVEIDLPTITGTVTHTELVINGTIETGASITYKLNNGTTDDTEETANTKNAYNLTGVPTKLKILLNPKETEPTNGNPSIKSYCLKLWKA